MARYAEPRYCEHRPGDKPEIKHSTVICQTHITIFFPPSLPHPQAPSARRPLPFTWARRGECIYLERGVPEVRRGEGGGDVVRVMRGNTARLMLSTSGRLAGLSQMVRGLAADKT